MSARGLSAIELLMRLRARGCDVELVGGTVSIRGPISDETAAQARAMKTALVALLTTEARLVETCRPGGDMSYDGLMDIVPVWARSERMARARVSKYVDAYHATLGPKRQGALNVRQVSAYRMRTDGQTFRRIAAALGITASRAAGIYRTVLCKLLRHPTLAGRCGLVPPLPDTLPKMNCGHCGSPLATCAERGDREDCYGGPI